MTARKLKVAEQPFSALIGRLPYSDEYDPKPILAAANRVALRGLICVSVPIHVENPSNGARLLCALEDAGLSTVAVVSWHRDRHIVTSRSRRVTNAWELILIMSRSPDWCVDREGPARPRRGMMGRESQFDEDFFLTCIGDFWPIRCDRRDRRLLPAALVLQLVQLAGLSQGDTILDPWGNPGVKEECDRMNLKYVDGGSKNPLRGEWAKRKNKEPKERTKMSKKLTEEDLKEVKQAIGDAEELVKNSLFFTESPALEVEVFKNPPMSDNLRTQFYSNKGTRLVEERECGPVHCASVAYLGELHDASMQVLAKLEELASKNEIHGHLCELSSIDLYRDTPSSPPKMAFALIYVKDPVSLDLTNPFEEVD